MDWDKFLLKRAKEDLSAFKDFDFDIKTKTDKHVFLQNKEGKFIVKYKKEQIKYNHFLERIKFIEDLFKKIKTEDLPDFVVKLYIYDSYGYDSDISFSWAKPYNKSGLLFPCWKFDDWENTKKKFETNYIPWEEKLDEPYFKGINSSRTRSNIRQIFHKLYPNNIILDDPVSSPVTDLMKYKVCFDLGGAKPWSVRTPYIDLSGSASLRVLHYYPKWGEKPWIQFYEDPKDLRGIFIEGNYDQPLKKEQISMLEDEVPLVLNTLYGKRAQNRAEKMREHMKSLTTKHMTNYISFICNYIGERQT
jgi:hypothetical protein